MTHRYKVNPQDKQVPQSGKVENDANKLGHGTATQKNEGQRTPQSRHDRENQVGNNQTQVRRGGVNQGDRVSARTVRRGG